METSKNSISDLYNKLQHSHIELQKVSCIVERLERGYFAYNRAIKEKRCTQDSELVIPCSVDLADIFDLIHHTLEIEIHTIDGCQANS
jgi:hypothetical protein